MRRTAYIAVVLTLLVLLYWPRPVAPPGEAEQITAAADAPVGDQAPGDEGVVPDSATDWSEFLREPVPSTLPPPSDRGLLQDLEQAVRDIPGLDEVERDPITVRPELAPLLPPPADTAEGEPEPDADP